MMMWLNRSVATLIATLHLLDIYRWVKEDIATAPVKGKVQLNV